MCGVFAVVRAADSAVSVSDLVFEACMALEYRGYDSAGVAWRLGQETHMRKQVGSMKGLAESCGHFEAESAMGHTRWATHGKPSEVNAHPMMSERFTLVHNGIVDGHEALRARALQQGRTFASETDTESLLMWMELHAAAQTGSVESYLPQLLADCPGAWSIVWMDREDPESIYAYAHGRPLWLAYAPGYGSMISSDVASLLPYASACASLDALMWVKLRPEGAYYYHEGSWQPMSYVPHGLSAVSVSKAGFDSYMLKEISEQPAVLYRQYKHYASDPQIVTWLDALSQAQEILILACGSSYYAASIARYVIERHVRVRVCVEIASEFRYRDPLITEGTFAIAVSQSGETADTLSAALWAKKQGARLGVICNVASSALAQQADVLLPLHADPEMSVASTKAFSAQVFALLYLAYRMRYGVLEPEDMEALCAGLQLQLGQHEEYRALGQELASYEHALYVGRDQCAPMAYEGALKLKEISYIHAEAYPAGELKHGPLALIDTRCPVIALVDLEHRERMRANIEEIKARSGVVFVLGEAPEACAPWPVGLPKFFSVLGYVIPLQLLAYYAAKERGYDVDRPRNLAKSVTVE